MLMFIAGFGFCAIICFFLYLCVSWGVQRCVKDNELVIAIYENKTDKWKITIADEIAFRRKFGKPGSIKYID
ncbi:hypothetical protein JDT36_16235 [Salmonella enterica subsp. enterica serovar Infantis]|uniref:DUF7299 family protein n=1 Tax=Salmonella enterica TaxID=28901 RepID=UPI00190B6BA8|nr:hypothetical protein [Salmonella enterica]MBK0264992.1 hypothetical protein [Salmonella enterica subsp. enterica serovar Infantis]